MTSERADALFEPAPLEGRVAAASELIDAQRYDDYVAMLSPMRRTVLELARRLPEAYAVVRTNRAAEFADWETLERELPALEAKVRPDAELRREIVLHPLHDHDFPQFAGPTRDAHLTTEAVFSLRPGLYRRVVMSKAWRSAAHEQPHWYQSFVRLEESVLTALTEALAGRIPAAVELARRCADLGHPEHRYRVYARELVALMSVADGSKIEAEQEYLEFALGPDGPPPRKLGEDLMELLPFLEIASPEYAAEAARVTRRIGDRLSSPRMMFQGELWSLAAAARAGRTHGAEQALPGVKRRARDAGNGLRALTSFVEGLATGGGPAFASAERLARRIGFVALQVAALTHLVSGDATGGRLHRLHQLLRATGWRRPIYVDETVLRRAVQNLSTAGQRSVAVLEVAAATRDPATMLEVARVHALDDGLPADIRIRAVDLMAAAGAEARTALAALGRRPDEIGRRAAEFVGRRSRRPGLSDREAEVIRLAANGLTNREIGARLFLSQHTVARHLDNARTKLSAANRAEAVARFLQAEAAAE